MSRMKLAGAYLRGFRERAGLSFNLAAEKLGCSLTLLSFIENGTRNLARKVSFQSVRELYGLAEAEVRLLQLLYGDKHLQLAPDRASWQLFATIADAWEAQPESFVTADVDELLGEGLALFQTHAAELHDIYARLCLARRDYVRAREHARQALESYRMDSFVALEGLYNNQGEIYFHEGQQLEARLQQEILRHQSAQLAGTPLSPELTESIAALRQQALTLYRQAQDCFERALASRPSYERGAFQLGLIFYNLGNLATMDQASDDQAPAAAFSQALEWLARVQQNRSGPQNPLSPEQDHRRKWACAFSILTQARLGRAEFAHQLLDAFICANPVYAFAHYLEAVICCHEQRCEAALSALLRAGALDPIWFQQALQEIEFFDLRVYLERQGSSLQDRLAQNGGKP
ncbi:MAG: helix-turn-helix domain-containing protein [Candidatus Sericytochromatia bacterium]